MQISRYKLCYYIFIVTFWLACCWGFVTDELLPPLQKLETIRNLVVDGVFVILGLCCLRNRNDVLFFVSFLVLSVASSFIVNHEGFSFYFNGMRDFIGLLFAVPIIRYFYTSEHADEFKRSFDKGLYVWLWLQAFCITWQFLRYGAGDMGGGTLGEGGSGMISMLIYVVSYYLVSPRWDKSSFWRSFLHNKIYIILLYPTFLNETKISFILFLLYFILLLEYNRKLLVRMVYLIPCAGLLLAGLFTVYISATDQDAEQYFGSEMYLDYFYGVDLDDLIDIGQRVQDGTLEVDQFAPWEQDMPRFAKIGLMMPVLASYNGGIWFGKGLGQFKGWTTGRMTHFAKEYQWLLLGSRPMFFFMIVQTGILGLIWLVWMIFANVYSGKTERPFGKRMRFLVIVCFVIIMVYNDSLREIVMCTMLLYPVVAARYYRNSTPDDDRPAVADD